MKTKRHLFAPTREAGKNLLFLILAMLYSTAGWAGKTLCEPSETSVFSCTLLRSGKIISLCGSDNLDEKFGYAQFRFGRDDDSSLELKYPSKKDHPRRYFKYYYEERPKAQIAALSFHIGVYRYSLFRTTSTRSYEGAGVIVSRKDGKVYRRVGFSQCALDSVQVVTNQNSILRDFNLLLLNLPDPEGDISYIGVEPDEDQKQPVAGEVEPRR